MLDFKKELDKLLASEDSVLEADEFGLLAAEGTRLLAAVDGKQAGISQQVDAVGKKQADISLQIEEIYDIVKEFDADKSALRSERALVEGLLKAVVGMSDMVEDFYNFTEQGGSEELVRQAQIMRKNADDLLGTCSVTRFGEAGQPLDPAEHSVYSSAVSAYPNEHVAKVLQSGYAYKGTVIRKATIIVSTGTG